MQTIIIVLDPAKLENPDLDLRYLVPERIEEITEGTICDNGYDYIDVPDGRPGPLMGIWLETASAEEGWPVVARLFQMERFLENDLAASAEIFVSEEDTAGLESCERRFP